MFQKILIANRGEIAVRIIRACREMGIKTVAVYSEADRDALHTLLADEAICIGPAPSTESYLDMERILTACVVMKADAIHPGFGFLSENARFAELCEKCNIRFIGPSAEIINKMGNKSEARKTMMAAGVPVVPGSKEPVYTVEEGLKTAKEVGFPVMIKASSGGGGKGMRVSRSEEDFEDEYIDLSDGLIHCKKCGGQRQTVVPCFGKSGYFMPRCICQCQREAEEQRKAAEERQRRMERIKRRKAQGLQDRYLYDYTFSNDNGQNPLMDKAHAYVENWKEAYKSNIGLLLFGDVGTGKSFFAGCIANALLDQDVPVLMTNFPTILNRLTGMFSEDRSEFIASFDEYDLLIIDDLGVERSTEYAMEQMFFVIDSRYRSRRPMIITTNLKLAELKNPPDLAHARIYDRILERCAPILFDGKNFREENAGATRQTAKDIVNSKHD